MLKDPADEFIIATEEGILHQMRRQAPNKVLIPAPPNQNCACNECPYMKLNTMEKLYLCMRDRAPELTLDPDLIRRAHAPTARMLSMLYGGVPSSCG